MQLLAIYEKPELIIESRKYLSTNIFPIDISLDFLLNVENNLVRNVVNVNIWFVKRNIQVSI